MLATETEKRTEKIGKQTQFLRGTGEERGKGARKGGEERGEVSRR